MSIAVLLATYNGERFLTEQIESLLNQTVKEFKIHVSDDQSQDGTLSIIESYAHRFPDKFVIHKKNTRLGAKENFYFLLGKVSSSYLFFCDQDDVWDPFKMEKLLKKMKQMEGVFGQIPLLVHCDLRVMNESLEVIHPSFWEYMGILPMEPHPLGRLLRYDAVTGCASLMNGALRELVVKKVPPVMHDAWMALGASIFGQIGVVREPLVDYRQHSQNVVGAKPPTFFKWLISGMNRHLFNKCPRRERAQFLLEYFNLPEKEKQVVLQFLKK